MPSVLFKRPERRMVSATNLASNTNLMSFVIFCANVMASVVWGKAAMAVDTHVFRVSNRIGLTRNSRTPLETERTLVKHIPEELIPKAHHWLILHGRYVCTARRPHCMECGLRDCCAYYKRNTRKNSRTENDDEATAD